MPYIEKPLGFSSFPKELTPVPRSWIETTGNLVHYKDHDKVCSCTQRDSTDTFREVTLPRSRDLRN